MLSQYWPAISSSDLGRWNGGQVTVAGHVHRVRQIGGIVFIVLRDASGMVQIVHQPTDAPLPKLSAETVISVVGTVVREERAATGWELHHPEVSVVSAVNDSLPFGLNSPALNVGLDTMLDHRMLALRHPRIRQIFRVQDALTRGFRDCLSALDFVEVHTPKLIAAASEGGANVFQVQYFERQAFLAQSPQLYKQMLVGALGRVFEIGPVFRAEPHDTGRHLSEYVSLDAEMGFIADHRTVMAVLAEAVATMIGAARQVADDYPTVWPELPGNIPRVHFEEALLLVSRGLGHDVTHEPDLAPSHEAWLGNWARTQFGSDFLFVEGYPLATRPFYTHGDPARPGYSNSFDLLFRGQEIVTGGQRLHQHADYVRALNERGLPSAGLGRYLETFRYGMPPHGGFAIGLERLTARLLGLPNIREASLFPRDRTRLEP